MSGFLHRLEMFFNHTNSLETAQKEQVGHSGGRRWYLVEKATSFISWLLSKLPSMSSSPQCLHVLRLSAESNNTSDKVTKVYRGQSALTGSSENEIIESIERFVSNFLQPYMNGSITQENEPKDRPPLIELLQVDLKKRYPSSTASDKWVEKIACKVYIKQAVIMFYNIQPSYYRDYIFDISPSVIEKERENLETIIDIFDKTCLEKKIEKLESMQQLFLTELVRAIEKDFPALPRDKALENLAYSVIENVKIEKQANELEIREYMNRHPKHDPLMLHTILFPEFDRNAFRQWSSVTDDSDSIKAYSEDELQLLHIVEEIENGCNLVINTVEHHNRPLLSVGEVKKLAEFQALDALFQRYTIAEEKKDEILQKLYKLCQIAS